MTMWPAEKARSISVRIPIPPSAYRFYCTANEEGSETGFEKAFAFALDAKETRFARGRGGL